MRRRSGKSKRSIRAIIGTFVAVAIVAAPACALAHPPAVDQYSANLPAAGGPKSPGGTPPVARPSLLPAKTRSALETNSDGPLLAQIATASALGAPSQPNGGGQSGSAGSSGAVSSAAQHLPNNGRGLAAAVADTAGTGPGVGLIAVLAAVVALAVAGLFRRRRSSTGRG